MDIAKGIALKLASLLLFAVMSALIRGLGHTIPVGQVVFFRSAFAIVPVVIIYAARRELVTRCAPTVCRGTSDAASSAYAPCS
jgi:drug/metabolite transporter (DMT)-like permease